MGGGQIQLVTYGSQDLYLTGNPQITHFKTVHRRYTNFAIESIMQPFNTSPEFGKTVSATLSKLGDLVYTMDVRVKLKSVPANGTDAFRWLNWLGHILIEYAEIEIGGQRIDRHYGHWLHIWNELTQTSGHQSGYARLSGNVPRLVQSTTGDVPAVVLYIPLQFWFNKNPGLALPLIALQYHDVKVNIKFAEREKCYWTNGNRIPDEIDTAELWVEYVYLDKDERTKFAQNPHEYLIEQVQFNGAQTYSGPQTNWNYRMAFNHPVKEVVWTVQKDSVVDTTQTAEYGGPQWFNYSDALDYTYFSGTPSDPLGGGIGTAAFGGGNWPYNMPMSGNVTDTANNILGGFSNIAVLNYNDLFGASSSSSSRAWTSQLPVFDSGENPIVNAKIQLNGQDRFMTREGLYFNTVQPLYRHNNCPAVGINVYSFALNPENFQPSGSCNFTRIDIATLQFELTANSVSNGESTDNVKLRVYGVNYNVLRIMSGMGGLAFNN